MPGIEDQVPALGDQDRRDLKGQGLSLLEESPPDLLHRGWMGQSPPVLRQGLNLGDAIIGHPQAKSYIALEEWKLQGIGQPLQGCQGQVLAGINREGALGVPSSARRAAPLPVKAPWA